MSTNSVSVQRHNVLGRAAARKVEDYILSIWPDIERHKWCFEQVALSASGKLGMSVTGPNIKSAVAALGRKWHSTPVERKRVDTARRNVVVDYAVVELVVRMAELIEVPVPRELREYLAERKPSANA